MYGTYLLNEGRVAQIKVRAVRLGLGDHQGAV